VGTDRTAPWAALGPWQSARGKGMAIPQRNTRGLQDIRTLSGQVDQTFLPYKAYLRIGCLEMEKARRGVERSSALSRVSNIDARFQEIEAEKAALLEALRESKSDAACLHRRGRFRFRY
jgi:hypothetical protein